MLDRTMTPEMGSMTPRVYTPPLVHHCTGPTADRSLHPKHPLYKIPLECPCGCGLNPDTSWGFSCNRFAREVLGWKLLPWQQWLNIHALEKNDEDGGFRFPILVVLVARQNGKALDRTTPILTAAGWSTMGDLEVGDEVFHPDGTPTTVIGTFDQPDGRTCYEVTTTDGRSVVADEEHLWTVQDSRKKSRQWETLTTAELLQRGLKRGVREQAFRLPRQHSIQSKPVELPIDPYILGAWLGDGSSTSPVIYAGDQDIAETLDNLLAAGAQLVSVKRKKTCWNLRINVGGGMRDGFEARCRQLGIWNGKSIPAQYLTAGTDQRLALLQGLLDTDGHISAKGQVEFCSTNRDIAEGFHYLARSLGYRPGRLSESPARLYGRDCGTRYRITFTPDKREPAPFRLGRKVAGVQEHPQPGTGRQVVSISSIQQVESRPVRCIKVDRNDGLFLAGRGLMPTHNTHWLKAVGLWRLFISRHGDADHTCPGARLALIAAQNLSYAETVLKEVVDAVRDNHALSQELINYRVTNGNNRLILSNRRYWRAATASRKGGRSLAVDIAMLDELREHVTSDAWDAIAPTTTSRSYSQIVCTSNAGDKRSEVLRSLRDPALKRITTKETTDTNIGLFEWSVPTDVDPRDDTYWHLANPALGHLNSFKLNDLRALFEAAQYRNLPGFQTENLCMWVDAVEPGIIPAIHWAETVDKESRRKDVNTPVYAGLDVNYERSRSFIAIASRRKDGNLHIEVINGARGTDWVIPWLAERKKMFKGVAVQAIGAPATSMIEDLRKAGVPVVEWGPGKEVANGSGEFYDGICEHKIFHRPAPVLDRAAAAGVPRNVGEGWVFDRRHSLVDVSPIVACVAAAWLEHRGPKAPPMIHAWPDEDTLKQWEDAADEQFPPPPPGTPARSKLDEIDGTTTWWTQ